MFSVVVRSIAITQRGPDGAEGRELWGLVAPDAPELRPLLSHLVSESVLGSTEGLGNGAVRNAVVVHPHGDDGVCVWIKVNDVADWEQKMIEVGCVHHGVLIHDARVADALAMFCKFMGIEAVRGA